MLEGAVNGAYINNQSQLESPSHADLVECEVHALTVDSTAFWAAKCVQTLLEVGVDNGTSQ